MSNIFKNIVLVKLYTVLFCALTSLVVKNSKSIATELHDNSILQHFLDQ